MDKSKKFVLLSKTGSIFLFAILIFLLVPLTAFAESYEYFSLMEYQSIQRGKTSILFSGSDITSYDLTQPDLVEVSETSWPLFNLAWRSTVYIRSWADMYAESYKITGVTLFNKFNVPALTPSDETHFIFTLYARLSSTVYTQPIEDSAVIINNEESFYPVKITKSSTGNYYTYAIDVSQQSEISSMDINIHFADFPSDVAGNLGRQFYITFQMSDVTVTHTLSATNQYLQDLNQRIEDLSSKLDIDNATHNDALHQNGKLDVNVSKGESVLNSIPAVSSVPTSKLADIFKYENLVPGDEALLYTDTIEPIIQDNKVETLMFVSAALTVGSYVLFGKKR